MQCLLTNSTASMMEVRSTDGPSKSDLCLIDSEIEVIYIHLRVSFMQVTDECNQLMKNFETE